MQAENHGRMEHKATSEIVERMWTQFGHFALLTAVTGYGGCCLVLLGLNLWLYLDVSSVVALQVNTFLNCMPQQPIGLMSVQVNRQHDISCLH